MGEIDARERARAVVYCLIPRRLAGKLHEPLRRHFAADPSVEVVVERRELERRGSQDRRATSAPAASRERRRIRGVGGRRVADRRATQVAAGWEPPMALPRRLRAYASQVVFVERILPSSQRREDEAAARLVVRFQSGEREVFGELYMQYFNAVYTYLRVIFRNDPHQAEDVTQQVFTNVLSALDRYERREQPFRAWLFIVVRNQALREFGRQSRSTSTDPAELSRRHEGATHDDTSLEALNWISDRELLMLVERLPMPQRQVLVLRHMLDLGTRDIARILDRTPDDVRKLDHRARRYLAERLTALGRTPAPTRKPMRWVGRTRWMPVGRSRRSVLLR